MRVAIVENTAGTQHGQVGMALAEAGAIVDQYRPYLGQALPDSIAGVDALVVFGGEQNALSDDTHPYLGPLQCADAPDGCGGSAVLGICLGAQLMARGFGARNHIGTAPEFGWVQISATDAGRLIRCYRLWRLILTPSNGIPTRLMHHRVRFILPKAQRVQNQAFRVGRAGYATQFHFEANHAVVTSWTKRFHSPD